MMLSMLHRMLRDCSGRCLWAFATRFLIGGALSVRRFEQRLRRGDRFPAFLFISVTDRCNLSCRGCWVAPGAAAAEMDAATLDRILTESKARGVRFFGILGGEPLLHPALWEVLARHGDAYFLLFTNGTLLTGEAAEAMARLGNVTPCVSLEGFEEACRERRGTAEAWTRAVEGLSLLRRARLVFGTTTSVCRNNLADLADEGFLRRLIGLGAHYAWYTIYRPVGPDPAPELALGREEILRLRRFLVEIRGRVPIAVLDSYWDADGKALCPAATGIALHINPRGAIEPCPPLQFARDSAAQPGFAAGLGDSAFLRDFGAWAAKTTRGCVLLDDPAGLSAFLRAQGAEATSGRDGYAELARMKVRPSHHVPGGEIPERDWATRMAKKRWFFGFGAYG